MSQLPLHWRDISSEPDIGGRPLGKEVCADVCVIGGGFTGLHAAIGLARGGMKSVVVEADGIGMAASGRNNGQVIPHHSKKSPSEVVKRFGTHRGDILNEIVASGPRNLFDMVDRYQIRCDLTANGWIQACHSRHAVERAQVFFKEWSAFGAPVEWLDRDATRDKIGSDAYLASWKARDAGHLNPYALAQGLARAAQQEGASIYPNSRVTAIERHNQEWLIRAGNGTVRSRLVLVCTNASTDRFWPGLNTAVIPVRVYQIATKPLPNELRSIVLPGREGVSDSMRDIRAFRYDSRGGLAMVGVHAVWQDARNRGIRRVGERLKGLFPQFPDNHIDAYWEGTIGVVPDRMPRLMKLAEGAYFAGIYSGRGVALSTGWGRMASEFLLGRRDEADLPVPLTGLRKVIAHGLAVKMAKYTPPFARLRDSVER